MHIFQLISGALFTVMTGAGIYMAFTQKNNVFFAAAILFLIIAISCFLLAAARIRKRKKAELQEAFEAEDSGEPAESAPAGAPDESTPPAADDGSQPAGQEETAEATDRLSVENEVSEEPEADPEDDMNQSIQIPNPPVDSEFFNENKTELSQMDTELVLTTTRANITGQDTGQMSKTELEDNILHTQIALNAFNRLKIFCDARGTEGNEFYAQRMEVHQSNPEFLTYEEMTKQMETLQTAYENYVEQAKTQDQAAQS